ncbi:MAG TPA: hypothetical protein VK177_05470 [Flavobacteriales bacterium]|nr:hypothetical protein [Flavobacteriales bacterium]
MSIRVVFYTPKSKKSLNQVFIENYEAFRDWSLGDSGYFEMYCADAQQFLLDNVTLKNVQDMDRFAFDDLINHFTGDYSAINETIFQFHWPMMRFDHYEDAVKLIEAKCTSDIQQLWQFLIKGRSPWDGSQGCYGHDNYSRVSYWTVQEQANMYSTLKKTFGTMQAHDGIKYILQVLEEIKNENAELIMNIG